MDNSEYEVKATLSISVLALVQDDMEVITQVEQCAGQDEGEQRAGLTGYIVHKDEKLWNIAKKYHTTITQGPFELKQGGSGIAVRNPVYLEDENGQEYFWGFTIVVIRVPKVFEDSTNALSKFRYTYRLSKQESPWNKKRLFLRKSHTPK